MKKTIYITEEQSKQIKSTILLEYGRNKTQKIVEEYIRRYTFSLVANYLDYRLDDLPHDLLVSFGPVRETNTWKNLVERGGTLMDFLRINLYSHFGFGHNNNPFFLPGTARIALSELGFYSFIPREMQGGKIVKLGNIVKIITKSPQLIKHLNLNEEFNDMNYEEVMNLLAPIVKTFKDKIWNDLDSDFQESHRYTIHPLTDIIERGQATPDYSTMRFLNQLSTYTDWCICGNMGDMEYAQYVSNGGRFYICLRDDYKTVQRQVGENCPLDDYGLSMIAVIVAPDGHVENTTTRWNHENGGENHNELWLATHLQSVLGIRYKDAFKPRPYNELIQMNISDDVIRESKTPSIYDQVKKVNSAVMANAAGIEEGAEPESDEYKIGGNDGNNGYFHVINESIDSENFDYEKAIDSIANFMRSEGLNVYPYPEVKLNWEDQDGLFIRTGYYEPDSKKVVLFCKDRHAKDILRSYAHEMIHHAQNLDGKDLSFSSNDDVKDNARLEKIEAEAYLKGNIYFRKWTEYEKSNKKSSLNENVDFESVTAQAPDDDINQTLDFGINVNVDEKDWLDLIFNGTKTIVTCGGQAYKKWRKHVNEIIGIVRTTRHPSKDNPSGVLVGYARLVNVKKYSDYDFSSDFVNHRIPIGSDDDGDRCGLVLTDVHELDNDIKLSKEKDTVRPLNYPDNTIDENIETELTGWHGSVADFDQFDEAFMSTGEGAQAYGWGTYITSCKGTGEHYAHIALRNNLSRMDIFPKEINPWLLLNKLIYNAELNKEDFVQGLNSIKILCQKVIGFNKYLEEGMGNSKVSTWIAKKVADINKIIAFYKKDKSLFDLAVSEYVNFFSQIEKVKNIDDAKAMLYCKMGKKLYKVDIPEDNGENYLPWHLPLSPKQHNLFLKLCNYYLPQVDKNVLYNGKTTTGHARELIESLNGSFTGQIGYMGLKELLSIVHNSNKFNIPKKTSKLLYYCGITGIKVPTGLRQSRKKDKSNITGDGYGTNYVLFNANDIKITDKSIVTEETNPEDIDLTSFNIKHNLNPKFWKNERLDSRIRMKLLDIADDFIEFLGIDWVKPEDIIMTGSLANFNWNKKFSDIDLHIVIDYSKVDKRKDFVANYFYSQKKLWNEEHEDLKIFGFPVEVYVQDKNEKHSSTGIYSLDKDKWIMEPEREKLSKAKVNKSYIKRKVAEYVDKIDDLLTIYKEAKGSDYKIKTVSEKADKLFDEIKDERSDGLKIADNEISNGNIIFKCLRRMGYIEKLVDLKSKTYNKINSLS